MLSQSTVSICREYLRNELEEIQNILQLNARAKLYASVYARKPTMEEQERFSEIEREQKRLKTRRSRLEKAIRDLKDNMYSGESSKDVGVLCIDIETMPSPDSLYAWPWGSVKRG